ncbi:MAG: hypothetical protein Q9M92_07315 [Enterobacterales bacterium]|nr:hypothetical protein [Enterobacterales bacterium]
MSVINEMLKDLEKGNNNTGNINQLNLAESKNTTKKRWIWGFLFILIVILAYYLGQSGIQENDKTSTKPQANHRISSTPNRNTAQFKIKQPQPKAVVNNAGATKATVKPVDVIEKVKQKRNSTDRTPKKIESASTIAKIQKPLVKSEKKLTVKKPSKRSLALKQYRSLASFWSSFSKNQKIEKIDQLIKTHGKFLLVWYKVLTLMELSEPQLYSHYLNLAVSRFPKNTNLLLLQARLYFKQSKYLKALQKINKTDQSNWLADDYRFIALVYQKNKLHQKAIELYRKSLNFNLNPGEINMALAISLQAIGENNKSLGRFMLALKDPLLTPIQKQFIEQQIAAYQE